MPIVPAPSGGGSSIDLTTETDFGTAASGAITVGKTGKTLTLNSTNHTVSSGGTVILDAAGVLELNSSAGVISIGNDAVAQNINIGTGAAARTITIGNVATSTTLALNSGTGGIALASTGSGDITINSDDKLLLDSDGVLELNSSAGVISIGNDAVAQNINIGTGAAARIITIGNKITSTALGLGSGTDGIIIDSVGKIDIYSESSDGILLDASFNDGHISLKPGESAGFIKLDGVIIATIDHLLGGPGVAGQLYIDDSSIEGVHILAVSQG